MRVLVVLVVLVASGLAVSAASCNPPPPPCNSPVTISTGGTYTGCWKSTDHTPAVTINTLQPVTITNSTISGGDQRIFAGGDADLTVTHTKFDGSTALNQSADDSFAVYANHAHHVDYEHNTATNGGGIKLNDWGGGSNPVTIRYNSFQNETGGAHAVQVAGVNDPNVDVSWNEIDNAPNQSLSGDNISIYGSNGTAASPISVHDNYINGGWNNPPSATPIFSTAIILGDGGGSYSIAQNNIAIRMPGNAYGIAGGHDMTLANNIDVTACQLPDGTQLTCGNGMYVNSASVPITGNAQAFNNSVGQMQGLRQPGRSDWSLPLCTGNCNNFHYPSTTLSPPSDCCSGPTITLSDESAQTTVWQNKLAANGVTIGA